MIGRALSSFALLYAFGFLWFAAALPQPVDGAKTDGIVVPTGGAGRIDRGLDVLRKHEAEAMLVTGVDREVKPGEFAAEYRVPAHIMSCCVTLGFAAVDTRGNAAETADWLKRNDYHSLRLVTTDWHMRRARFELRQALPPDVQILADAVRSEPDLRILLTEYHKYLLRRVAGLFGI